MPPGRQLAHPVVGTGFLAWHRVWLGLSHGEAAVMKNGPGTVLGLMEGQGGSAGPSASWPSTESRVTFSASASAVLQGRGEVSQCSTFPGWELGSGCSREAGAPCWGRIVRMAIVAAAVHSCPPSPSPTQACLVPDSPRPVWEVRPEPPCRIQSS